MDYLPELEPGKRRLNLRAKLLIGFTITFSAVFFGSYYWFYHFTVDRVITHLEEDLRAIALGTAEGVDVDELIDLSEFGARNAEGFSDDPRYQAQLAWLTQVQTLSPNVWLFTFRPGEKLQRQSVGSAQLDAHQREYEIIYLVDTWVSHNPQKAVEFLEPATATPYHIRVLNQGTLEFRDFYTDQWGSWITMYVPLRDDQGDIVAALGADIEASYVQDIQRSIARQCAIAFGISYSSFAVLIYLLSGRLTRPLKLVRTAAQRIGLGDASFHEDLVTLTKKPLQDEVTDLAQALLTMEANLRDRQQQLQHTQQERDRFFNESIDLMAIFDENGRIQQVNPAWLKTLGYEVEQLIGHNLQEFIHPEDWGETLACQTNISQGNPVSNLHHRWRSHSGDYHWLSWNFVVFPEERQVYGFARDITDQQIAWAHRQRAEKALRESETRLNVIVNSTTDGILILDQEGEVLFANPSACKLFQRSLEDLLSQNLGIPIAPRRKAELEILRRDGNICVAEMNIVSTYWQGQSVFVVSVRDISDRKIAEKKLLHSAFYDSLTKLPNRRHFQKRLQMAINKAQTRPDCLFALLFIDLDHFKLVNDSLGHIVGDQLLQKIGQLLRNGVKERDLIARLGGDEFAVLLENVQSVENTVKVAERIQRQLQHPFHCQEQEFFITASIGIAFSRHQLTGIVYASAEDWLRDADIAMYRAKSQGKANYEIFDAQMHLNVLTRLSIERDLRRAIERHELDLYYQPIVSLVTGELSGFEALLRWHHRERGSISPTQFIPIAEETGLIVPIGEWVLQTACHQLWRWIREGLVDPNVTMSVNLASQQFAQVNLVNHIQSILDTAEISPSNLRIEVTESAITENMERVADRLRQLRQVGVRVSIDDFGTGYSSLARLQRLPIDVLKIDRSFVTHIAERQEDYEFVKAIVNFAHSLGLDVVAEGIEGVDQQRCLHGLGCEYGQGFLYARSLPADRVGSWIDRFAPRRVV